jgi:1,4-dihydroxy-2-naphthoyl-CoA hydrolase
MPAATAPGIKVEETAPELVRGRLRCTASGLLHGRAVMSLADTVGAVCALLNLPPGAGTATVESTTSFPRGRRSRVSASA